MHNRGNKLQFLLHSLGKFLTAFVGNARQFHALKPCANARVSIGARNAFQFGNEAQKIRHAHLAVYAALLGQISNAIFGVKRGAIKHANSAGVWKQDAHDHANGGAFACAVWTKKSTDLTALNFKRDIAYSVQGAKALVHVCKLDDNVLHERAM